MNQLRSYTVVISLVTIVALGTVFYRYVEGWGWLDSYFFTVITLSTVGYGSLVPATAIGKIGTTVFIFVGLGIFALAIQGFAGSYVLKRARRAERETEKIIDHKAKDAPPTDSDGGPPTSDPDRR